MNNFNEKLTNFKIYELSNNTELGTINNVDLIPFSNTCYANFDLLNIFENKSYFVTLNIYDENNNKSMIFATRIKIDSDNVLKKNLDDNYGSVRGGFNFTLTIPKENTYKITLELISNEQTIHSVSQYYIFKKENLC